MAAAALNPSLLKPTLLDDAASRTYRWLFRPMLVFQCLLYCKAMLWLVWQPTFANVGGAVDPQLHENHLGNLSILNSQPNPVLLSIHMTMALCWIAAVLFQKSSVTQMARALSRDGGRADGRAYAAFRRRHAVVGTALCVVAFSGCIAGPLIAFQSHGHPAMRAFLLLLPLYFLPAIIMVWVTARRRKLADHQAWANTAFLAPAIASLWAEALIYVCGRHSPLGARTGELVGTGLAYVLIVFAVVVPTWRARRRLLAQTSPLGPGTEALTAPKAV